MHNSVHDDHSFTSNVASHNDTDIASHNDTDVASHNDDRPGRLLIHDPPRLAGTSLGVPASSRVYR